MRPERTWDRPVTVGTTRETLWSAQLLTRVAGSYGARHTRGRNSFTSFRMRVVIVYRHRGHRGLPLAVGTTSREVL